MRSSILIIAEIGSVHDGSFGNAKKLIELAKACGADAVKFQTHIASAETLRNAPAPPYFTGEPRYEYFERTAFTPMQWKELKRHADKTKIEFLSSPFSIEAVDLLESIGMKRYKIPSGEVTNLPMLKRIAATKKQVLLSSGMSSWTELDEAVATIKKIHSKIVVLQCTSEYPCQPGRVGLNILEEMKRRYDLPVGFSDHMLTNEAAFVAAFMGITVLEKHLTFSRAMYGSDAKNALEPAEFAALVRGVRSVEAMRAAPMKMETAAHVGHMKKIFEKSVVSLAPISKGTVFTTELIGCKKPGTGIPAKQFDSILGKQAKRSIAADTLLRRGDF